MRPARRTISDRARSGRDDRGRHIQAHGGGIIRLGDTFYWFGEDRSRDNERGKLRLPEPHEWTLDIGTGEATIGK